MKNAFLSSIVILISIVFVSFINPATLRGTWEFQGGSYNGKVEGPPVGYTLQRNYTDHNFNAYVIQKGSKAEKYEAGKYTLKGDTCLETTTFDSQPSKLLNITIHYHCTINNGVMSLAATLPTGMAVIEKWKKVK
jgi:hypothetical protein